MHNAENLASFPSFPTIQFLIACSMQKRRGEAWSIYHVNIVSVYLDRQRGQVRCPRSKECISCTCYWFGTRTGMFETPALWSRNYRIKPQPRSFVFFPPSLPKYIARQCLFSLYGTSVTTLWLKQLSCF